jgi:hypothetical protein
MKRLLVVALSSIFFLASCEKDTSEENSLPPGTIVGAGNGGTGTGGGSTSGAGCKDCIYIPVCSGSVYHYNDTSFSTPNGGPLDYTLQFIKDTTIGAKVYQKFANLGSSSPFTYYNCTNGVTTAIVYNGTTVSGNTTITEAKITGLKANEPVGATWSDVLINQGQTINYLYTIIAKGVPRTVKGILYPDVIQVHSQTSIDLAGTSIPAGQGEYYYARGTGLIESVLTDDFTGNQVLHRVLVSAMIP